MFLKLLDGSFSLVIHQYVDLEEHQRLRLSILQLLFWRISWLLHEMFNMFWLLLEITIASCSHYQNSNIDLGHNRNVLPEKFSDCF